MSMKNQTKSRDLKEDVLLLDKLDVKQMPSDFLNRYSTHIICREGKGQFQLGGTLFQIEKNDLVILVPGSNAFDVLISPDFEAYIFMISRAFLEEIRPNNKLSVEGYLYVLKNPIMKLTDIERELFENNCRQIAQRIGNHDNAFQKEILTCLTHIFIYDIWEIYSNELNKKEMTNDGTNLFERFLLLSQDHCFTEREVAFYSSKLNVTPKYLSAVCKKTSGKTASDWIDEYTIQHIRLLLKNDKISIKDIANQMNFSNQSFFGRYVKRLLGASPTEYRQKKSEEKTN